MGFGFLFVFVDWSKAGWKGTRKKAQAHKVSSYQIKGGRGVKYEASRIHSLSNIRTYSTPFLAQWFSFDLCTLTQRTVYVCHSSTHLDDVERTASSFGMKEREKMSEMRQWSRERENERLFAREWGKVNERSNGTELRFRLVWNRSSAPFITVETENSDFPSVFRKANAAKGLETINRRMLVCAIFDVPVITAYCHTERRSFSSSVSFPLSSILFLSVSLSFVWSMRSTFFQQQNISFFFSILNF